MRIKKRLLLYILLTILIAVPQVVLSLSNWKTLITDSFIVYYPEGYEIYAYSALQALEFHRPYAEELTGNSRKRFAIIIEDIGNIANGFANPIADKIVLFTHIPTGADLGYVEDWWSMLGVHEHIHILQMTNEGGIPKILRKAFGNIMYTNWLQPTFMLEGITVFGESDIHPYTGRMNGGYFPAIISTLALTGELPNQTKANYFSSDYPLGNFYVYGGSFYSHLSDRYGKEKFSELYDIRGRSLSSWITPLLPGIGVDRAFKRVYGKNISMLWKEWQDYEKAKDFNLPDNYLTEDGWQKSRLTIRGDKLYYLSRNVSKTSAGRNFVYHSLKSYDINTGEITELHKQAGQYTAGYYISFDNNDLPAYLYYTRNEYSKGFANITGLGSISELYKLNLHTSSKDKLFQGNFRAFGLLADGTVIVSKDKEKHLGSELYLINENSPELLMTSDYLIHKIKVNNDRIYVSARSFWRNSSIFELDLETKRLVEIINNPVSENISGFYENMIIYTANYDNYLSAYLIEPDSKKVKRIAGSSFMTSTNISNNMTYYLSLSPKGFEVSSAELSLKDFTVPFFKENPQPFSQIKDCTNISLQDRTVLELPPAYSREYTKSVPVKESGYWRNISHLLIPRQYRIPSIVYSDDEFEITYEIGGNDAIGHFPQWSAILKYDIKQAEYNYEFYFTNRLLLPIKHNLYYSNIGDKTIISDQYIDIINRLNWGLTNLRAGMSYETKQDFQRKIINPYIEVSFDGLNNQVWNRFSLMTERDDNIFSSDRNRNGFRIYNNIRQKLIFDSELIFRLFSAYDPEADDDEVFKRIRGYGQGLQATQGVVLQSTLSKILFQVRKGLWDPQLYVEDVGLSLFFDTAAPREGQGVDMQYGFGLEVIAETNFGFFFPIFTGYQLSYNRENEIKHTFLIHTTFLFENLWKW